MAKKPQSKPYHFYIYVYIYTHMESGLFVQIGFLVQLISLLAN